MTHPSRQTNPAHNQTTSDQPVGGCFPSIYAPTLLVLAFSLLLAMMALCASSPTTLPSANLAANPGTSAGLAPLFTLEVQYWGTQIVTWANEWGLDSNLVATVMQIESCGDPWAKSSAGAMGLFQVMPFHFGAGEDPYKPAINAWRGLSYLSKSLASTNGDSRRALAGYNSGISRGLGSESLWPSETVRYVYWGTGIYGDAMAGKSSSATLDEWLGRGGVGLCAQARQRLGINP